MHLKTEILRAYLDNALLPSDQLQVKTHLSACSKCSQDMEVIRQRIKMIGTHLKTLDNRPINTNSAKQAFARFKTKVRFK